MRHVTVLKEKAIDLLIDKKSEGIFVDCTLGSGGHSLELLSRLKKGQLVIFDLDSEAIREFENKYAENDGRNRHVQIHKYNTNFIDLNQKLEELDIKQIDGAILDLGWSMDELDTIPGLSYEVEQAELDMRFDKSTNVKASDLLNALGKKELKKMFEIYGDVFGKTSLNLVDAIIDKRKEKNFETVADLNELLEQMRINKDDLISLKTRVYQSLRIAVNDEIRNLKSILESVDKFLIISGRIVIITFHSGEEKIIKDFLKTNTESYTNLINSDFLRPDVDEILKNYSSRSAKLWALEKIK